MLKRTKGRLLITLLVVTGLAGTIHDSALSQKERKSASIQLKNTREALLESVRGLNQRQLRFRSAPGEISIDEYVRSLALSEAQSHEALHSSMSTPCNAENRALVHLTDAQVTNLNDLEFFPVSALLRDPVVAQGKRTVDLLIQFQSTRQNHIKYIRTSTEDLRNHMVQTPAGWMDAYQFILSLAAQTNAVTEKITAIKHLPGFPKYSSWHRDQ